MSLEGQYIGRYQLQHLLGSGGMGEVYLANDPLIHRQVALKVIKAEASPYPNLPAVQEAARLFGREMKAIASLDHPNILPLFDYGESQVQNATLTFMVMPYRPEGSLTNWLHARGSAGLLPPQEVASLIGQAASALQHAHTRQIIHQDVKPANFLLRLDEENPDHPTLLLADFGVARYTSATTNDSQTIRGTPGYMAPEQWEGHPVPATDQYALAVMAYELLTGRQPFQGGLSQLMYQHFHTAPPLPGSLNPRLPAGVDRVLLQALAKKPDQRFPSISAFARALQEAVSAQSPVAGPDQVTSPEQASGESEMRATLAISASEALTGTSRILTLPGGRRVTVTVPAGASTGQILHLPGPTGTLILTLTIEDTTVRVPPSTAGEVEPTARVSAPYLQQRPVWRSNLPASGQSLPAQPLVQRAITAVGGMSSTGKVLLLIGVVLLLIVSGAGIFSAFHPNQGSIPPVNSIAQHTALARSATASAVAANPYGGKLVLDDSLRNSTNNNHRWIEASNTSGGSCGFTGGAYHANAPDTAVFIACIASATDFSNFAYEVQMTILKGDIGGLVIRADSLNDKYYVIGYSSTGYYDAAICFPGFTCQGVVAYAFSSAIKQGLNQINIIAVVATGSIITLYVNHKKITAFNDSTYDHGQIGVIASGFATNGHPTEVAYNNAKVWTF
ncbi:MAG TPA: protein kinase [Ktedonobacteraceae bacterium]|nr:protein kinase [Ktedonobacteraceae bacterium]